MFPVWVRYNLPLSIHKKRRGLRCSFVQVLSQSPAETTIKHYQDFNLSAKGYFEAGKRQFFSKPEFCPFCKGFSSCLIGWGFYWRNACDGFEWYRIPIKIFKCKRQQHGGYVSIHPTFLLPYRQYSFSLIYEVLHRYFLLGLTMKESLTQVFRKEILPSYQTFQHWIRGLKKRSGLWIALLQQEGRFTVPRTVNSFRPNDLVHVMEVLRTYLLIQEDVCGETLIPASILNRYRGSPLTPVRW